MSQLPVSGHVSEFIFSILEEDHPDYWAFAVRMHRHQDGRWSLRQMGGIYYWNFVDGRWEFTVKAEMDSVRWRREHLADGPTAHVAATTATNLARINGLRARDVIDRYDENGELREEYR